MMLNYQIISSMLWLLILSLASKKDDPLIVEPPDPLFRVVGTLSRSTQFQPAFTSMHKLEVM